MHRICILYSYLFEQTQLFIFLNFLSGKVNSFEISLILSGVKKIGQ